MNVLNNNINIDVDDIISKLSYKWNPTKAFLSKISYEIKTNRQAIEARINCIV